jgi:hypothetical protein
MNKETKDCHFCSAAHRAAARRGHSVEELLLPGWDSNSSGFSASMVPFNTPKWGIPASHFRHTDMATLDGQDDLQHDLQLFHMFYPRTRSAGNGLFV